ncbi:UDP-glucuronate decarboxylase [Hoeflea marina]|uniref:UDP-glucuronate decarboxylase n=1 Tax=Hoeflea marina TaxID=274592 RepID=A0A317PTB1_9HYPH|nr:UDP-glucuronic acid decarboxylase family protein [Hoeflea marina]PWW04399.1 UDP-glucuronate decarboxylase [Hoeflea marina]
MAKRVLVTGGAGFVGAHLCRRLVERGDRVTCLDNLSSGSAANVAPLKTSNRFDLVRSDVRAAFDFDVDEIYNLASPASPPRYQADPVGTMMTNVTGALHVLELAERRGAKVLQASTSEVYGDPKIHPQPESYWGNVNPTGVRACYDEGKRAAEALFCDFQRSRGVRIRLARIFNTYGPGMDIDDGRVVSNFIVQALRGDSLTIHGDGSQTRSFCYRDDLVTGLIALMDADDEVGFPVNLGNPVEFTMVELARMVIELTGSVSRLEHRPLPSDDPALRCPDITLARSLLGWEPKLDLRAGLRLTIADFSARLGLAADLAHRIADAGSGHRDPAP